MSLHNMYNFPQSSCDCSCDGPCKPGVMQHSGIKSSLGVRNCDTSAFDHTDVQGFGSKVQPQYNQQGFTYLNPSVLDSSSGNGEYTKIVCHGTNTGCNKIQYASGDPRLIDIPRSLAITLDRPPTDSAVKLSEVYSREDLRNYGQGYNDYTDINAGQIMYYIDKSIQDPFITPIIGDQANVNGYMYQDPMGGLKPHYYRQPFTSTDHLNTKNNHYSGCLSWIQDSNNQRDDLQASRIWKQNQQKWTGRWSAYDNK